MLKLDLALAVIYPHPCAPAFLATGFPSLSGTEPLRRSSPHGAVGWILPEVYVVRKFCTNRTALLRSYQPDEETRARQAQARAPAQVMLLAEPTGPAALSRKGLSDSCALDESKGSHTALCSPLCLDWIWAGEARLGDVWVFLSDHCDEPVFVTISSHYLSMSSVRTGTMSAWLSSVYP